MGGVETTDIETAEVKIIEAEPITLHNPHKDHPSSHLHSRLPTPFQLISHPDHSDDRDICSKKRDLFARTITDTRELGIPSALPYIILSTVTERLVVRSVTTSEPLLLYVFVFSRGCGCQSLPKHPNRPTRSQSLIIAHKSKIPK